MPTAVNETYHHEKLAGNIRQSQNFSYNKKRSKQKQVLHQIHESLNSALTVAPILNSLIFSFNYTQHFLHFCVAGMFGIFIFLYYHKQAPNRLTTQGGSRIEKEKSFELYFALKIKEKSNKIVSSEITMRLLNEWLGMLMNHLNLLQRICLCQA